MYESLTDCSLVISCIRPDMLQETMAAVYAVQAQYSNNWILCILQTMDFFFSNIHAGKGWYAVF